MRGLIPHGTVLLLSYGGPNGPEDVLPFLHDAARGRGIPEERFLAVGRYYERFQGASSISVWNRRLLADLRRELRRCGHEISVGWGNRNWHPLVDEGLTELADARARRTLVLPTFAYASYSGCRQYRKDLSSVLTSFEGRYGYAALGVESSADDTEDALLIVDKVRPFYNTPEMAGAQTKAITVAYRRFADDGIDVEDVRLVLVTHSIPVAMEEGSAPTGVGRSSIAPDLSTEISYVAQHRVLIQALPPLVRGSLGLSRIEWNSAFCLHSGLAWSWRLEPDVNDLLEELADGGAGDERRELEQKADGGSTHGRPARKGPTGKPPASGAVVAPIGFIHDHMEVVYDLDIEARGIAVKVGLPYERAAMVSTDGDLIASLIDVLEERAAQVRGEDVQSVILTGVGPFHTVCLEQCCRSGRLGVRQ